MIHESAEKSYKLFSPNLNKIRLDRFFWPFEGTGVYVFYMCFRILFILKVCITRTKSLKGLFSKLVALVSNITSISCKRRKSTSLVQIIYHSSNLMFLDLYLTPGIREEGVLPNLVPRAFQKWVGREKALASAGHVYSLNIPEKLIYMQPAGFALTEGSNNGQ